MSARDDRSALSFVTTHAQQTTAPESFLIPAISPTSPHRCGLAHALPRLSLREKEVVVIDMKIEIPFLAGLLFLGTDLLARAAAQGFEQALFSTAIKYGLNGLRAGLRLLPNTVRCGW